MEECVLWTERIDPGGYGRLGRRTYVHRAIWEIWHGPIPEGQDVHHRCGSKNCINVTHMELRSHADHARVHALEKWQPGGALREMTK